jgi:DNA polymerase III delta prime subunit
MDTLHINKHLHREEQEHAMKQLLNDFELNKHNLLFKKGIYVYGDPGSGKSTFVTNILKEMKYDIVRYDAGDIRNASVIDSITKHHISDKNIMSLFHGNVKKIAIIMDEIDGMNNGDKGGINSLIKLIRPKKTKKQKLEKVSMNPIICIGNYKIDKKIKELMKVCNVIELKTPVVNDMNYITKCILPTLTEATLTKIVSYCQGDLRKLNSMVNLLKHKPEIMNDDNTLNTILQIKSYNDDTKKITSQLLNDKMYMNDHNVIMNETDRTSVGLLWHENIIDFIDKVDKKISIPFYISQLDNICFSDYIDRITFQNQIWQFNEMSSLIKTFKNNKLYHETFLHPKKAEPQNVRFTKVLTKYSTEYNNTVFIQKLCQQLGMDKKDLLGFFVKLNTTHDHSDIVKCLEDYEIGKLDINRIYKYIEKYIKEEADGTIDKDIEEYDVEDIEE